MKNESTKTPMLSAGREKRLWHMLYSFRFEILLISLLIVFLVNILFPFNIHGGFAQTFYLPLQLLAGIILFEKKRYLLWGLFAFSITIYISHILHFFFIAELEKQLMLLYILFFGSVTLELFRQMSHIRAVTMQSVMAALCGLLLIGYCAFYIFLAIEIHSPGSFKGIGSGQDIYNDLFYYSYITMLTIGYGDIVPLTWIARNITVFLGVIGYIYAIVVVAAIVGRLQRSPSPAPQNFFQTHIHNIDMPCRETHQLAEIIHLLSVLRAPNTTPKDITQGGDVADYLETLCRQYRKRGLRIQCHAHLIPTLAPERTQALCCMAHEAIKNACKHASARHIYVILDVQGDFITLSIEDDGMGFDPEKLDKGLGLRCIYAYAHMVDAEAFISSSQGYGSHVLVQIPLQP